MKVEVHLHATLRLATQKAGRQKITLDLPPGSSISHILDQLKIEIEPAHLLLVLNGRTSTIDQELKDGDVLNLMTAVSGGK
jgi:molybdopterin converting factor small subunit